MTKGNTPQERLDNQSDEERKNAAHVAKSVGGLTAPPETEWQPDYEWCHLHDLQFTITHYHAWPKRDTRRVYIPKLPPPPALTTEPDDLFAMPMTMRTAQVVREEWIESVMIPTRTTYNAERNVLTIWYRQEVHLFTIWIGDDPDAVSDAK